MKIQTFSIVVGTRACNAKCPFCVSKMTGFEELPKERSINLRNFKKAAMLADRAGTTTVLMTGKGEPTLYPDEVSHYLYLLQDYPFPLIELQTNGLSMGRLAVSHYMGVEKDNNWSQGLSAVHLNNWHTLGLNTIALSVVGTVQQHNAKVYLGDPDADYPPLAATIRYLHQIGFTVRLCVMMMNGGVGSPNWVRRTIEFCREHRVEQLTLRPLRRPHQTSSPDASAYVNRYGLGQDQIRDIRLAVAEIGTPLISLMHGAEVYDVDGQNVCLSDCLTIDPSNGDIRTLIFYSNGRLTHDWQYKGAVLLGGQQ